MPEYPIDLGKKYSGPSPIKILGDATVHYPSLHLEWDKSYDLPDEGEMTIKFKKVSESTSTRDGKTHQSVSLDITKIVDVEDESGEPGDSPAEDAGEILDKLRAALEDNKGAE